MEQEDTDHEVDVRQTISWWGLHGPKVLIILLLVALAVVMFSSWYSNRQLVDRYNECVFTLKYVANMTGII
jgi:hypothetical protein